MDRRFIYADNGTLTDYSVQLQDYHAGSSTFTLVAAEDAIYIGSRLPFNHLFFKVGTANSNVASMNILYWSGTEFTSVVDSIDETASSGVTLAQSGFVTWTPNKNTSWQREDSEDITELSSIVVYERYWLKITFSADLSADVALSWCGQKFSNDHELGSEYSDLDRSEMKAAFESGKTDWEEQHVRAAQIIVQDLINDGLIIEKEQILQREDFRLASVSKCAEIIYGGMGDDYKDDKKAARDEYRVRIGKVFPKIDKDRNGREDDYERVTQGSLYR
jgi:hypothetical protein